MAWRALPIRTFRCPNCGALHDEACPPIECRNTWDDYVPAADFQLPASHMNQHGVGLINAAEAEAWVTAREARREEAA